MRYTLIGNFQYDLGVFGLKKILDFFDEPYETDGKFYIEVNKTPEQILELVILKLILQESYKYFWEKVVESLSKVELKKDSNQYEQLQKEFEGIVKKEKSIDSAIRFLSDSIFKNLQDYPDIEITYEDIEGFVWSKAVDLLNKILLNFQADKNLRGKDVFNKAVEKLNKDTNEKTVCTFCGKHPGKRITRDTFFFGPSQFNAFWFNESSIFICPYCIASNLAITQSLIPLEESKTTVVAYRPNLEDLENLNSGLVESIEKYFEKIIEYEKLSLKKEATTKDLQILEFYLDSKNPNLEIYILTEEVIKNIIKVNLQLEKLFIGNYDLRGQIKDKNEYKTIYLSKEILKYLTQNQKLIFLVQRFAKLGIMAESFRQKNVRNPSVKGFYIHVLLEILKIHFILEGLGMNSFDLFKDYGQFLRGKVIKKLSDGQEVNWNTFNNKIISLANSFLDASKGSFSQFMETFTRVIISYDAPIDAQLLKMINKDTYREISTTIALSLMTGKTSSEEQTTKKSEE